MISKVNSETMLITSRNDDKSYKHELIFFLNYPQSIKEKRRSFNLFLFVKNNKF